MAHTTSRNTRTVLAANSEDFLVIRRGPAGVAIEAHSREDEWESATVGAFDLDALIGTLQMLASTLPALDAAPTTDEPDRSFLEAAADDWHSAAVQASGEALAAASRARRAESALEDLREQYGTAVREKDEWEANAEEADARAEKAEQERDEARAEARTAASLVTAHEGMSARDHLAAAWEAAHVPEDGIIPAEAEYIMRSHRTGRLVTPAHEKACVDLPAMEVTHESRLLDPPAPKRPDGAEQIEAVLYDEWTFSEADGGEEAFADLADRLASHGVRVVTEEDPR